MIYKTIINRIIFSSCKLKESCSLACVIGGLVLRQEERFGCCQVQVQFRVYTFKLLASEQRVFCVVFCKECFQFFKDEFSLSQ